MESTLHSAEVNDNKSVATPNGQGGSTGREGSPLSGDGGADIGDGGSGGGVAFTNETLRDAVNAWLRNPDDAARQYGPIGDWNVSNVTDMNCMFWGASSFDQRMRPASVARNSVSQSKASIEEASAGAMSSGTKISTGEEESSEREGSRSHGDGGANAGGG